MLLNENRHQVTLDLAVLVIARASAAFPANQIQSAARVGLPNFFGGEQGRVAADDPPSQFHAEPKMRRPLQVLQEFIADNGRYTKKANGRFVSLTVIDDGSCATCFGLQQETPCGW